MGRPPKQRWTSEGDRQEHARVGSIIKFHRMRRGLSQTAMALRIGVCCQQQQKYENGTNALPIAKVPLVCAALDITPSVLFDTKDAVANVSAADLHVQRTVAALSRLPPALQGSISAMVYSVAKTVINQTGNEHPA